MTGTLLNIKVVHPLMTGVLLNTKELHPLMTGTLLNTKEVHPLMTGTLLNTKAVHPPMTGTPLDRMKHLRTYHSLQAFQQRNIKADQVTHIYMNYISCWAKSLIW